MLVVYVFVKCLVGCTLRSPVGDFVCYVVKLVMFWVGLRSGVACILVGVLLVWLLWAKF